VDFALKVIRLSDDTTVRLQVGRLTYCVKGKEAMVTGL